VDKCNKKYMEYRSYVRDSKDKKAVLKDELRVLKHEANKEMRAYYKGWFRTLDIIGIILLLLNFGALFLTGILVIRADPGHTFAEANPIQCQWNGWTCHTDWKAVFLPFLRQAIIWGILAALYIYQRYNTYTITGLWFLTGMMVLISVLLTWDFLNDFGLYLGKVLFAQVVT